MGIQNIKLSFALRSSTPIEGLQIVMQLELGFVVLLARNFGFVGALISSDSADVAAWWLVH